MSTVKLELAKITAAAAAGRLAGADKIGIRVGKVIGRYKMAKHYQLDITEEAFTYTRDQASIHTAAALDGIYVIRTSVPATDMATDQVVATYKSLARVERDFASLKAIDLAATGPDGRRSSAHVPLTGRLDGDKSDRI